MTDQNRTKATNAAMAGVAGAVIGAGVAVAATKVLSDKKTRDRVTGTLTKMKDQVMESMQDVQMQNSAGTKGGQKKLGNRNNHKKVTSSKSKKSDASAMPMQSH